MCDVARNLCLVDFLVGNTKWTTLGEFPFG
jgi:hypothetical protein